MARNDGLAAVAAAQAEAEREHMLQDAAQAALVQKLVDAERAIVSDSPRLSASRPVRAVRSAPSSFHRRLT